MAKPTSADHHILIAGDGIAGLAIALGLANIGITSSIISAPTQAPPKGGVQLAPNSWAALSALGMGDAASPTALTPPNVALSVLRLMSLSRGHNLLQLPLNDRPSRTPYTSVTRADLLDGLKKAAIASKKVAWINGQVAEVTTKNARAEVALANGDQLTASWLIGADGMMGACRQYLEAPDASALRPDRIARRMAFRMVIPKTALPAGLSSAASTVWLGDGGHLVHYPLTGGADGTDGSVNVVAVVSQSPSAKIRATAMMQQQPQLSALIPFMEDALEQPLYDHASLDAFQRGRVVLAGDAAHPMPPHLAQGAGQSLIDGASLMQAVAGHSADDDLTPIFTAWTAARVRAVKKVTASANRAGAIFALSGPMAKLRNLSLAHMGGVMLERQLNQLWQDRTYL